MNNKTLPMLKKEQSEFYSELKDLYKNLGFRLLDDASNPTTASTIVENDELIQWQKLREERESCTDHILNIKSNEERLEELSKFQNEVEKSIKDDNKIITGIRADFLFTLYKNFSMQCTRLFAPVISELHRIDDDITPISSEIQTLENDKKEANFFTKMAISTKILLKEKKRNQLEKKQKSILSSNITDIHGNEEINSLHNMDAFSEDMKKQFEELEKLYNRIGDAQKRSNVLTEEKDSVIKNLSDLEASTKSSKRIASLNDRIKEIDTTINELASNLALRFTNQFYDEEGASLAETETSNKELEPYQEALNKISSYRIKTAKIKYNIMYCEVNKRIKDETSKIQNAEKVISNSKNSIKELEEKIKAFELSKKNSEDEVKSLQVEAEKLKEKFEENLDLTEPNKD